MLQYSSFMKANIHPNYNSEVPVTCACGNTFTTGSTLTEIKVELCAACHPFFTGEVRYVDLAGRVDRFTAKLAKHEETKSAAKTSKTTKTKSSSKTQDPMSLKDMLQHAKKNLTKAEN